jgi:hypothetical protein
VRLDHITPKRFVPNVADRGWVLTRFATYVETNCTNPRWASHDSPVANGLPGGHSEWEPPDPFSNSEVKTLRADASVGFVNAKVGHCQALDLKIENPPTVKRRWGFFFDFGYVAVFTADAAGRRPWISRTGMRSTIPWNATSERGIDELLTADRDFSRLPGLRISGLTE